MTEKLFDLDSYCTRFSASVLSCEPASKNGMQGFAVKLDRTCFFPEGGGQPADTGCLQAGGQSAQVLYTYEQGYTMEPDYVLIDQGEVVLNMGRHSAIILCSR